MLYMTSRHVIILTKVIVVAFNFNLVYIFKLLCNNIFHDIITLQNGLFVICGKKTFNENKLLT